MKKTLVALAAVSAAAGAFAQSNVTIYGLIDLNLSHERSGDQRYQGVHHGELNGSRLGFRGNEDLGNGIKAVFVLEQGFNIDVGTSRATGRSAAFATTACCPRPTRTSWPLPCRCSCSPISASLFRCSAWCTWKTVFA